MHVPAFKASATSSYLTVSNSSPALGIKGIQVDIMLSYK